MRAIFARPMLCIEKERKKSHLFIEKFRVIFNKLPCHAYGSSHIFRYFTMFISFYYNHYLCAHIWIDLEKIVFLFFRFTLSLARFAPYFYPTVIFAALLSPFPISLPVLFVTAALLLPSMPMGYVRRTHEPAGCRAAKCSNWQRIRCFSHVYIRFNPFLCYSISVNLLSVQWQRKNKCDFNVLSVKNRF